MPKSCIICSAVASPELQLQYCAACQSAVYCSRACQRKDWNKQHRQICKLLNVGHGDMQVRTNDHTKRSNAVKELFERGERSLDEGMKRFFKLFQESTLEGSRAAARKMKKFAKRQTKNNQKFMLSHSLCFLIMSDSEMLSWPNSPLLVLLKFVDPNVMFGDVIKDEDAPLEENETRETPLHHLADMANPSDYSTHEKQLILAKQLIEHGADVNAVSIPHGMTPLHKACFVGNVTNLDFVEYLLKVGADPNIQEHLGMTPLMYTLLDAPGAANFLLNWSTTDDNVTSRTGMSFMAGILRTVKSLSDKVALPDNPDRVQHQFSLQQWRKIEEMMVERAVIETGIITLE